MLSNLHCSKLVLASNHVSERFLSLMVKKHQCLLQNVSPNFTQHSRMYSNKGFIANLIDKMREEARKDKAMKDSLSKFREEASRLEKSDEMQKMRGFYKKLEDNVRKDTADKLKGTVESVRQKVSEQEYLSKAAQSVSKTAESMSKQAGKFGSHVSQSAKTLSESEFLQKAKTGAKVVEREIEGEFALKVYSRPSILFTREELSGVSSASATRVVDPNMDEQRMVLHKDSKWAEAWSNFRDTNPYVQKFFDIKTQFDESENPVFRGTKFISDRIRTLFGGMLTNSEFQEVLTEISKVEPEFDVNRFAFFCRTEIIPNVLEAMIQGDLRVLQSWCHEAPFSILSQPLKNAQKLNCVQDSRILDVSLPEVSMAKIMEQGPVLVITFQAQQISVVRDASNKVVEGDPNKILRFTHVWALCRDPTEMNPKTAWRVLEIAMIPAEQWV